MNLFKSNPAKKLQKKYEQKLTEALLAQRGGNIQGFASLTEEAQKIKAQIDALQAD